MEDMSWVVNELSPAKARAFRLWNVKEEDVIGDDDNDDGANP